MTQVFFPKSCIFCGKVKKCFKQVGNMCKMHKRKEMGELISHPISYSANEIFRLPDYSVLPKSDTID